MRIRRVSPLFLLLAPCLVSAEADSAAWLRKSRSRPQSGVAGRDRTVPLARRDALPEVVEVAKEAAANAAAAAPRGTSTSRPYRGTEDAPVDGLDGKPHAGPFVDTTPESAKTLKEGAEATATAKARPTSLDRFEGSDDGWRLEDIPEKNDGVMNDENRQAPRKGTTGTEGGISEKDKERRLKGLGEKKPQEPKEAPPLPHSEQERIEEDQERAQEKSKQTPSNKDGDKPGKPAEQRSGGYGTGGYGMEKPADLPEKPHNIPHPEPKVATQPPGSKEEGPPVDRGRDKWLADTMPYTEGKTNPRPPKTGRPKTPADNNASAIPEAEEEGWHEWFHSFVLSLTMILFSEIGDKTFLIAALMAMRHPRVLVFSAAFGALIVMTVLSAVLGHAVPTLLPKRFTTFAAALLFLVFGARMLREGLAMPKEAGVGDEMREVEAELEEKEHSMARDASRRRRSSAVSPFALESGRGGGGKESLKMTPRSEPSPPSSRSPSPPADGRRDRLAGLMNLCSLVLSPAWVQTFIMTFLGEWGDRSQIATIAMAAGQDYWWVTLGAITGHACCTGLAVVGGRALAGRVSMRVVTIGGAVAFLVFGVIYLVECITDA